MTQILNLDRLRQRLENGRLLCNKHQQLQSSKYNPCIKFSSHEFKTLTLIRRYNSVCVLHTKQYVISDSDSMIRRTVSGKRASYVVSR